MNISKFVWIIVLITIGQIKLSAQVDWSAYQFPLNGKVYELELSISEPNTIYSIYYDYAENEHQFIKSADLGDSWEELSAPPNIDWDTRIIVDPTNSTTLFSHLDSPPSLFKSVNGGNAWVEINTPTTYTVDGFDVDANGNLWGCYHNDLLKSTDGGDNWDIIYSNPTAHINYISCFKSNNNIIYLVSGLEVIRSTDGGDNWSIVYLFPEFQYPIPQLLIDPNNFNVVYVLTEDSTLITTDGFSTSSWQNITHILAVDSEGSLYRTSESGLFKSTTYGNTWTQTSNSGRVYLGVLAIHPTNPQIMLASSHYDASLYGVGVLRSIDGGAEWFQYFGIEESSVRGMDFSYSSNYSFVDNYDGIFLKEGIEDNWQWIGSSISPAKFFVHSQNANYQIIASADEFITTNNGGGLWLVGTPIPHTEWDNIIMSPNNPQVLFAWEQGLNNLYKSINYGQTWELITVPQGAINRLELSTNIDSLVFLYDYDSIYLSDNLGGEWVQLTFPDSITYTPYGPFIPPNRDNTQIYFGTNTNSWEYSTITSNDNSTTFNVIKCNLPTNIFNVGNNIIFNPFNDHQLLSIKSHNLLLSWNSGVDWQLLNNPNSPNNDFQTVYCHPEDQYKIIAETNEGWFEGDLTSIVSISNEDQLTAIPQQIILYNNFPNPWNATTTISYDIPTQSTVSVTIYDIQGRFVKTLINYTADPGRYSVTWGGTNDLSQLVSGGVYLYRIQAGDYLQTKKMLLLK